MLHLETPPNISCFNRDNTRIFASILTKIEVGLVGWFGSGLITQHLHILALFVGILKLMNLNKRHSVSSLQKQKGPGAQDLQSPPDRVQACDIGWNCALEAGDTGETPFLKTYLLF